MGRPRWHGGAGGGSNPFEGFGGAGGQNITFDFGDMGLGDIFSQFFGGGTRAAVRQEANGKPAAMM